jgi:hypothetical protein
MLKILVAVLIAALPVAAQVSPSLLQLLPEDVKVIGGVNTEAARNTPFGQYVEDQMREHSADIDKLLSETDFDLREDLAEIVAATTGFTKNSRGVILAQGVFNPDRIVAHAEAKGAVVSTFGAVKMIRGHHDHSGALAFLSMDQAAIGRTEDVLAVVERLQSGAASTSPTIDAALQIGENNQAWFVADGSIAELTGRDDVVPEGAPIRGDLIRAINQLSGGVSFGETVVVTANAGTDTPDAAMALGSVVQFFMSFARLNSKDPELSELLGRMLQDLEITTRSSGVTVTLPIAQTDLEAFLDRMHKAHAERHQNVDRTAGDSEGRVGRSSGSGRGR